MFIELDALGAAPRRMISAGAWRGFRVGDADFTAAEARCEPCRASMLKPDKKSCR